MPEFKIDKKLNIVLEVEQEDKSIIYVHSSPIARPVYEMHYMFLAEVVNELYTRLRNPLMAARVCHLTMKEISDSDSKYNKVPETLFADVWRLTNVVLPSPEGWKPMPFYDVMQRQLLSDEDLEEVKSFILFFTAASWVHGRKERTGLYQFLTASGVQTTSLPFMEFVRSLPTSTPAENSGETATALSTTH
jgi:hypothetical protein